MDLPLVVERLSHGEASWFINDKKNFVAMSDHHHDDRVSVTFAAGFEWLIRIAGPLLFALLVLAALLGLGRLTWRATERRRSRIS